MVTKWGLATIEDSNKTTRRFHTTQVGQKIAQDAPHSSKMAQECPQAGPRYPQDGPRDAQDGPKSDKNSSKTPPRCAEETLRMAEKALALVPKVPLSHKVNLRKT